LRFECRTNIRLFMVIAQSRQRISATAVTQCQKWAEKWDKKQDGLWAEWQIAEWIQSAIKGII
jgi:hypothetical protein